MSKSITPNHREVLAAQDAGTITPFYVEGDRTSGAIFVSPVQTSFSMPTTLISFITTVSTAGTRVQLASNVVTNGFILEAPSTNGGLIYVGGSTVSSTVFGAELQPGQSTSVAISNTNKIYIDASSSGDQCALIGS